MLEKEEINKKDSVEEIFCKPFEDLNVEPMDKETSGFLIQIMLSEGIDIPEKEKPFVLKIIEKRIEVLYTYKITDTKLLIFLTYISETPGKAVMYLTYLQYWANKNNKKEIDLEIFCNDIFPSGFPSEEELNKLWDKQKVKSTPDNLIDYPSAMESIF